MTTETETRPFYVAYADLERVIGIIWSRVHIANMVKAGTFPAPYQISENRVAWLYDDLLQWKSGRPRSPRQQRVPIDPDEKDTRKADRVARKRERHA